MGRSQLLDYWTILIMARGRAHPFQRGLDLETVIFIRPQV